MSTVAQRSFAGGEISPALYARADIVKYITGLRKCLNFFIRKEGGASNRAGLRFVAATKYSNKRARLLPFVFNDDQTYVLEFGDQYIRFIRNGALIEVSGVAAYSGATAYVIGDLVVSGGINYYCIANTTGNAPPNATYWYALTGTIYEIPTPYLEADLQDLQISQSGDIIFITHQSYPVRELSRYGHTDWTLLASTFAPSISAPTGLAVSGGAGSTDQWVVTAIKTETFEESLATSPVGASSKATTSSPRTLTWTAVSGAQEYNVYKNINGVYGFIGVAGSTSFVDDGIEPDATDTPPQARNPFASSGNYPATSGFFQQRLGFANTLNDPEKCWFSKSGQFRNFTTSAPLQDDDAVTFNLAGRKINQVQHLMDLGNLIALTSGGETLIQGDTAGILKPGEINPKAQSYNGSSNKRPIFINDNALYLQNRGSIIRDLFSTIDATGNIGYKGTDLTVFATHLFRGYQVADWDFAQNPNSIVWAVRNDGWLLGLTYLKEHQIWAWHKHNTLGSFENICVVPEGDEDVPYFIVNRTINGSTVRYIERMETKLITDIEDYIGMDSALTYDGRNDTAITMILTGSGWTYTDTLTLTASAAFFSAGDVGNQIWMNDPNGTGVIRCTITAFTSSTIVSVKPHKTVPVSLQAVAILDWERAADVMTGLDHLEGEDVVVLANGFVVANPYNSTYTTITVTGGQITLPKPYSVVHVGLPFIADLQTLDIDSAGTETLSDKKKIVQRVTAFVEDSRSIWAGANTPDETVSYLDGLTEYKPRENESYDDPPALISSDQIEINIQPEWNSNGRVLIRQVEPLPLTVLAVMPAGMFPVRGA